MNSNRTVMFLERHLDVTKNNNDIKKNVKTKKGLFVFHLNLSKVIACIDDFQFSQSFQIRLENQTQIINDK